MANAEQLARLKSSIAEQNSCAAWNQWRKENRAIMIDLTGAKLTGAKLRGVNLFDAYLIQANLDGADLTDADLTDADFSLAHLIGANLTRADLSRARLTDVHLYDANLTEAHLIDANLTFAKLYDANLTGADLTGANLTLADFTDADLTGANLSRCALVETRLWRVNMSNATVYGVAVWDIETEGANQANLIITPPDEPIITVDDLEVAQFIYLLLNNHKLRKVISTMAHKAVLILGRFTADRLAVLNTIRDSLRAHDYLPILFDFEKAPERDYTETVVALAHLCRFVIADLTDPRSIQQELTAFVPTLEIPVQPIIEHPQQPWAMFNDFRRKYHWVLPPYEYADMSSLMDALSDSVLAPAEAKAKEIQRQPW